MKTLATIGFTLALTICSFAQDEKKDLKKTTLQESQTSPYSSVPEDIITDGEKNVIWPPMDSPVEDQESLTLPTTTNDEELADFPTNSILGAEDFDSGIDEATPADSKDF